MHCPGFPPVFLCEISFRTFTLAMHHTPFVVANKKRNPSQMVNTVLRDCTKAASSYRIQLTAPAGETRQVPINTLCSSVPAATYVQDPTTGVWTITPGVSILTVTGTV